jgi:hypothetical protein
VAVDEVAERANELVVVSEIVDAVVVVERVTQLRAQVLPVGVGDAEGRRPDLSQTADERPDVGRKVRR